MGRPARETTRVEIDQKTPTKSQVSKIPRKSPQKSPQKPPQQPPPQKPLQNSIELAKTRRPQAIEILKTRTTLIYHKMELNWLRQRTVSITIKRMMCLPLQFTIIATIRMLE